MKVCPNPKCRADNRDEDSFCVRCAQFLGQKRVCPKCQMVIDPSWPECAYCKAKTSGAAAAPVITTPQPPPPPSPSGGAQFNTARSAAPPPRPPGGGRLGKTRFQPIDPTRGVAPVDAAAAPATQAVPRPHGRRVVGVLITYTWKPEGDVFPVREGRNLIGRDPEQCDIVIKDDPSLSGVNTHITYNRRFVIGDMISMSGTEVNGEPILDQFSALYNYSTIRTGSTIWTFIQVDPEVAA